MLTGPDTGRGEVGFEGLGVDGSTIDGLGVEVVGAGEGELVGDASLHPTSPTNSTTTPTSLTRRR
ncbi:hypothetical protein [Kribbella sp. NPDC055071]